MKAILFGIICLLYKSLGLTVSNNFTIDVQSYAEEIYTSLIQRAVATVGNGRVSLDNTQIDLAGSYLLNLNNRYVEDITEFQIFGQATQFVDATSQNPVILINFQYPELMTCRKGLISPIFCIPITSKSDMGYHLLENTVIDIKSYSRDLLEDRRRFIMNDYNGVVRLNDIRRDITTDRFADSLVFNDEATFHLNGNVNHHNIMIWSTESPHVIMEHSRNSTKPLNDLKKRISAVVETISEDMLGCIWAKMDYCRDVCHGINVFWYLVLHQNYSQNLG
uniref:Uncharacterized protein n=1 Tax=Timema genevievae TaxID=629358 RepID=A0A7R9PLP4_TIMGE|nr:unnamed protein product [Timema genevievae]